MFKYFIYLFLDRREGKEKERERNINVWLPVVRRLLRICPATQTCALSGNWTCDPLVRRPVLDSLSHTSQGTSQFLSLGKNTGLYSKNHFWINRLIQFSCLTTFCPSFIITNIQWIFTKYLLYVELYIIGLVSLPDIFKMVLRQVLLLLLLFPPLYKWENWGSETSAIAT